MPSSVGLELGEAVVRGAILERQGSSVRLIAAAQAPCLGQTTEDLFAAIKQLRKALPIRSPLILGISTRLAIVTTVQPLVVHRKRADLAIQFELQQHLPYDVGQTVWHYQWLSANGTKRLTGPASAVVAAMKRSLLEERLSACLRAGLTVQAVEVSSVAAVNAWVRQYGDPAAYGILLNISGGNLEWIVVTPSRLHVFPAVLPVPSKDVAQVDQGQLTAILKTSWGSILELFPTTKAPTVWLLGESALSPQLAQDLKRELACQVEVLNPSSIVRLERASPPNPEQYVVTFGLALQGLGAARLPVNLLIEITRQRVATRLRGMARFASFLCVLLAVAFSASGMAAILLRRQTLLQSLAKQEQTYEALRPEVRLLLQRQRELEDRLHQLEGLALARSLIPQAFQRLSEALPNEVWLTKIELAKDGTLDGVLEGYSRSFQDVTRLMDSLKSSIGWETVRPLATTVTTEQASGKELIAFTMQVQQPLLPIERQEESPHGPSR